MSTPPRRRPGGAMVLGGAVTVVAQLPVFLTGAMAVQLMQDLRFGAAGLGLAVGMYRLAAAVSVPFLGKFVDRLGASASLRLAAAVAVLASIGIATTARSWATLVVWLVVASLANSLGQPAANRMLMNNVPARRRGIAFGVKQSALPVASMFAGLSVPLVALTFGWRWAFVMGAVLAVAVLLAVGRRRPPPPRQHRAASGSIAPDERPTFVLLGCALGLSTAASSTVPAFYVDAAVTAGSSQQFAGTLLAVGSAAAIATRLVSGLQADRMARGHLHLCAALVVLGAVGLTTLATDRPDLMAIGVVLALVGVWGFNGVFIYAVVRAFPDSPGTVTGAVMPGGLIGGTAGPAIFGALVAGTSYGLAWGVAALFALLSAGAMLAGARQLARG